MIQFHNNVVLKFWHWFAFLGRVPVRLYVWNVSEDFDELEDAPPIDSWDKLSYINRPVEIQGGGKFAYFLYEEPILGISAHGEFNIFVLLILQFRSFNALGCSRVQFFLVTSQNRQKENLLSTFLWNALLIWKNRSSFRSIPWPALFCFPPHLMFLVVMSNVSKQGYLTHDCLYWSWYQLKYCTLLGNNIRLNEKERCHRQFVFSIWSSTWDTCSWIQVSGTILH